MADAKLTKIGIDATVAAEVAAAEEAKSSYEGTAAPNITERRIVGKREVPAPNGTVIVIENL